MRNPVNVTQGEKAGYSRRGEYCDARPGFLSLLGQLGLRELEVLVQLDLHEFDLLVNQGTRLMREILDQLDGRALTDDVAVDDRHLCTPARKAPHRRRVAAAVAAGTLVAAVARGFHEP